MYSIDTTKYLIHIHIEAEGVVEKTDVVGAIFGQTEGLLGEDMDLRDLQRSGRVGRIDVQIDSKHGKTSGELYIASSLDRAETAILAAALETIDRVGPCIAMINVRNIEDLRAIKRRQIVARAKELLFESFDEIGLSTNEILAEVREASRVVKITSIGEEHLPAGPTVLESDAIIILEGRADVLNLLRCGIKNTVAVEGTKVPDIVADLSRKKNATVFVDGDRGGDLILSELLQVGDIDFVAFSPRGRSVEDMTRKEIIKSLRNKVPADLVRSRLAINEPVAEIATDITKMEESADDVTVDLSVADITEPEEIVVEEPIAEVIPEPESIPEPEVIPEAPVKKAPVEKKQSPSRGKKPENPSTISEHAAYMCQTGRARVLSEDAALLGDYSLNEMDDILPKLKAEAYGIMIDSTVNQKFVDTAFKKGIKYIVAKDFDGIVRRPIGIRLINL